jgi:hypothetical protein
MLTWPRFSLPTGVLASLPIEKVQLLSSMRVPGRILGVRLTLFRVWARSLVVGGVGLGRKTR